jgi:colanic acid/amylovoran biosynthesis glycosyltransferase
MKMSIAFIVWKFPSLSETFILNQITGLIDREQKVDIFALNGRPPGYSKIHPDVESYRLLDRTFYAPELPKNYLVRLLKGVGLVLANFFKDPLLLLRSLNVFQYGKHAASLRVLYATIPLLGKGSYDIIHCQYGTIGLYGLLLRRIGVLKGKLVTSFRGYDISQELKKHGEKIYDELFAGGDFFFTNCEYFKRRLVSLGCDEKKVAVHASGIDCDRFFFASDRRRPDRPIRVVTTGRLVEKKGIEYGIRAIAKLAKVYPNIEYHIIGNGPLREELQQLIRDLAVNGNVALLGEKNQSDIIDILENSHIFIGPSITAGDGDEDAPLNTLKEAMAMGLPVIGTQHGGIPELIQDGVSGYLVRERDAEAIAAKLAFLIEHPQVAAQMGRAGRERIEEHYNLTKLNDHLVEIYRRLLVNGCAAPTTSKPDLAGHKHLLGESEAACVQN